MEALADIAVVESVSEALPRLHPEAFGWALALTAGDRAEAEDVLQIAYLRALDGRARFAGRSTVKTWLFGVVRRVAAERRRRATVRRLADRLLGRAAEEADAAPDPGELLARRDEAARIRLALARLSPRQREVLHLVFYQELTIEQAAAVAGIGFGSARTHYERGKARLRALLAEDEP